MKQVIIADTYERALNYLREKGHKGQLPTIITQAVQLEGCHMDKTMITVIPTARYNPEYRAMMEVIRRNTR